MRLLMNSYSYVLHFLYSPRFPSTIYLFHFEGNIVYDCLFDARFVIFLKINSPYILNYSDSFTRILDKH